MNQALAHFQFGFTHILIVFHSLPVPEWSLALSHRGLLKLLGGVNGVAPTIVLWDPVPFSCHGMISCNSPMKILMGMITNCGFLHIEDAFGLWLGLFFCMFFSQSWITNDVCSKNKSGSTKQKISSHESFAWFFWWRQIMGSAKHPARSVKVKNFKSSGGPTTRPGISSWDFIVIRI